MSNIDQEIESAEKAGDRYAHAHRIVAEVAADLDLRGLLNWCDQPDELRRRAHDLLGAMNQLNACADYLDTI